MSLHSGFTHMQGMRVFLPEGQMMFGGQECPPSFGTCVFLPEGQMMLGGQECPLSFGTRVFLPEGQMMFGGLENPPSCSSAYHRITLSVRFLANALNALICSSVKSVV